jgi:hypothetical protein
MTTLLTDAEIIALYPKCGHGVCQTPALRVGNCGTWWCDDHGESAAARDCEHAPALRALLARARASEQRRTTSREDVHCTMCKRGKDDWRASGGMLGCRADGGGPHAWSDE